MFEIVNEQAAGPVIRVIGVGGAGGNAVDHMIEQGVEGVEFFAVNTDAQVLSRSKARNQIQLGTSGLGAGAKPEEARSVALADCDIACGAAAIRQAATAALSSRRFVRRGIEIS